MIKNLSKFIGLLTVLTISSVLFGSGKAHAATINVVAGTDAINNANNQCQLSEAIQNINNQLVTNDDCIAGDSNNDTINLPTGTITLSADLPTITRSAKVIGQGMANSIVNGAGQYIAFTTFGASLSSEMSDFKVTGFRQSGIFTNVPYVTLNRIEVDGTGSVVEPSLGNLIGGIYLRADGIANANYSVSDIYIHDLNADADGGVYGFLSTTNAGNTENLDVSNMTITRLNNTGSGAQAHSTGFGLSIGSLGPPSTGTINAQIKNVTVDEIYSDNSYTAGFGAAVIAQGGAASAILTVRNVTVTRVQGNSFQPVPSVTIPAVAFYTTSAGIGNGDVGNAVINSQNVLLADNSSDGNAYTCATIDLTDIFSSTGVSNSAINSLGHNIVDDNSCTSFNSTGDQQNQSNLGNFLGSLQINGGVTPTRALLSGSPAIAAGTSVLGISTDQRGIARPNTPDVGAYQTVLGASTTTPATNFAGVAVPNTGLGQTSSNSSSSAILHMVITFFVVIMALAIRTTHKTKQNA